MLKRQNGFSTIEVLLAIALLGVVAVAYLSALSTSSKALMLADEQATAESLSRAQLEYIKNQEYIDYLEAGHVEYQLISIPSPYTEVYSISYPITVKSLDPYNYDPDAKQYAVLLPPDEDKGLQEVTVQVYHQSKLVLETSAYKMKP